MKEPIYITLTNYESGDPFQLDISLIDSYAGNEHNSYVFIKDTRSAILVRESFSYLEELDNKLKAE